MPKTTKMYASIYVRLENIHVTLLYIFVYFSLQ